MVSRFLLLGVQFPEAHNQAMRPFQECVLPLVSIKAMFHSTLFFLAVKLIKRKIMLLPSRACWLAQHIASKLPLGFADGSWQKRGENEETEISESSIQEQKQNKIVARRKKKKGIQWIQWRLVPAEAKRAGSYTGLKVGAIKACMLGRELPELHNMGLMEKGKADP